MRAHRSPLDSQVWIYTMLGQPVRLVLGTCKHPTWEGPPDVFISKQDKCLKTYFTQMFCKALLIAWHKNQSYHETQERHVTSLSVTLATTYARRG